MMFPPNLQFTPPPKPTTRSPHSTMKQHSSSLLSDLLLFLSGAFFAIFLFWFFYSFITSTPSSLPTFTFTSTSTTATATATATATFYSDPSLTYTITNPLRDWDSKRRQWLSHNPSFKPTSPTTVLLISGSQPTPCSNPIGDHFLLRLFKNKADYCRIHGHGFFYNNLLFHPKMHEYWSKIPTVWSAMVAHPEAEWIWWVDADAAITDMDFRIPLDKYRNHNLVVHGWHDEVFVEKSWTGLNAGVFLIRNCQWSLDFMEVWAKMGPQTPDYHQWGKTQKAVIKNKLYPESDDQSGLVYLLLKEGSKWGDKVYLESEYYLNGYWVEILARLKNITKEDMEMERRTAALRRRHAEVVRKKVEEIGGRRNIRPFVTHFTGCQPCTGEHNAIYFGEKCWDGLRQALDFADDQVLRYYGFRHVGPSKAAEVRPVPFDYPADKNT